MTGGPAVSTLAGVACPMVGEALTNAISAAIAGLYRQFYGHDRTTATTYLSSERAEEAVQDAFVSVWRTRARYDQGRGGIQNWIFALVRNRSIDIYRHNRRGDGLRASEAHLDRIAHDRSVEDDAVKRDEGERVRGTLHQMPALQREVIALAYFAGLSHSEIAQRLDVPLGTVKGRMRLGLEKARAEIVFQG